MKIELKQIEPDHIDIYIEGNYFDKVGHIEDALDIIGNLWLFQQNDMTKDFTNWLIAVPVQGKEPGSDPS